MPEGSSFRPNTGNFVLRIIQSRDEPENPDPLGLVVYASEAAISLDLACWGATVYS